jgi:hypothetical protein
MDYAMYRAEAARAAETAARAAKPRRKYGGAIPPVGLKKSQFLHWDFWANFLTTAKRDFAQTPALRFVFWVEDDAAFRPSGETCPADRVLQACESNWPSATWCGYSRVGGQPRYQSHLLAVTKQSCEALRRELHRDQVGDWFGLDTAIYRVAAVGFEGRELVKHPSHSLCYQVKHGLEGRR